MATFIRTPRGDWKALIRRRGWPTSCKTFRLKSDAQDWARIAEDEIRRGIHIRHDPPQHLLFSAALKRYLRDVTPKKKPRSQVSEKQRAALLDAFFGKYALSAITPTLVAKYRDRRLASKVGSPGWSRHHPARLLAPSTVRMELALLSHLFTVAIREWRLGLLHNPVNGIQRPSPSVSRERRLEPGEERGLMAAIGAHPNPMLGWIVHLAIETGMRAGEIGSLRLEQVDLVRRTVALENTKNGSDRCVPLTRTATKVLKTAIAHAGRPDQCDLIFYGQPKPDGRCNPYQFSNPWWKIKTRLGLKDLRFHDLRHEAISRFVEAGLSDQQVASISGHKSMQMLKRYTHLRAENLVVVLDRQAQPKKQRRRRSSVSPELHPAKGQETPSPSGT